MSTIKSALKTFVALIVFATLLFVLLITGILTAIF